MSSADARRAFFQAWVACRRKGQDGRYQGLFAMQGPILPQPMREFVQLINLLRPEDSVGAGSEANKEPPGGEIATIGRVWGTGLCKH